MMEELKDRLDELSSELSGIKTELFMLAGLLAPGSSRNFSGNTVSETLTSIGLHVDRIGDELDILSKP